MRLIDADKYRKEYMESRTFEPLKILDMQPTIEPPDVTKEINSCSQLKEMVIPKMEYAIDQAFRMGITGGEKVRLEEKIEEIMKIANAFSFVTGIQSTQEGVKTEKAIELECLKKILYEVLIK